MLDWLVDLTYPAAVLLLAISNLLTVRDLKRLTKENREHHRAIDDLAGLLMEYVPGAREQMERDLANGRRE